MRSMFAIVSLSDGGRLCTAPHRALPRATAHHHASLFDLFLLRPTSFITTISLQKIFATPRLGRV
jgi:hypothetical protein